MLLLFRCSCGGSENLIRKTLQKAKYKDWLRAPIVVGKNDSIRFLESSDLPKDNVEIRSLIRYLKGASKFAIILGVRDGLIKWANLSDGTQTSILDAKVIVEKLG